MDYMSTELIYHYSNMYVSVCSIVSYVHILVYMYTVFGYYKFMINNYT